MRIDPATLVEKTMAPLREAGVPEELQRSLACHQANLVALAESLIAGGQDQRVVQETLDSVFNTYKAEFTRTIMALKSERE